MISAGVLELPWWGDVLVAQGLTHISIAAVPILRRHQACHGRSLRLRCSGVA
jgi:hypothetical protein